MKKSIDGACPECEATELALAIDKTEYSTCAYVDGKFVATYSSTEDREDEGDETLESQPVRFFCTKCGTYMEVPKEFK